MSVRSKIISGVIAGLLFGSPAYAQTKTWKAVNPTASSAASGAGRTCYYKTQDGAACGDGFTQVPGTHYSGGDGVYESICCTISAGADALPVGYLVRIYTTWTGNLGGLAGANAKCLSELSNYPWKGKADSTSRGLLTASKVRAFLCDNATCQNPKPLTQYQFARAGDVSNGGASALSGIDSNQWPRDNATWNTKAYFNENTYH